jgi:hypothetical protein
MCYSHAAPHAADWVCPVAFSGARETSCDYHEYELTELNEPRDRVRHEDVAPHYSSQQCLENPRSLSKGAIIVVPKRSLKALERKQEKYVHHWSGQCIVDQQEL